IVEGGPDGFLAAEPDIQELARELGIEGRLVDQVARGSTLWTGRRLEPLAEGKAAELLGIQVNGNVGGFRTFATGMADVVEALVACLSSPPRLRTTQGVTAVAPAELAAILGIKADPLWARAFHWPRGLPRYSRGHADRVAVVRERLAGLAPLAIAGAGFDGAGVSACVKSGREAARVILKRLGAPPVRGGSRD